MNSTRQPAGPTRCCARCPANRSRPRGVLAVRSPGLFPDEVVGGHNLTTVGYGDRFPITAIGRAIGTVVMILGIGLFGLLAASLASFFVEKDIEKELDPQMAQLNERLARIEALLENIQPPTTDTRAVRHESGPGVEG
jgi:hypothetical protein